MTSDTWFQCYDEPLAETWKPVLGYDGLYEVSNYGRVWTLAKTGRAARKHLLSPQQNTKGYCRITLRKNGVAQSSVVHRLVLLAFVGPCPSLYHECNHKNGIKWDNRLRNLEWVTRKENNAHAVRNGYWKPWRGEAHGRAKLTDDDVRYLRRVWGTKRLCDLAKEFQMSSTAIQRAATGYTWKHVPMQKGEEL